MRPEQQKMIEQLRDSRLGDILVQYIKDLIDGICDIRKMSEVNESERKARLIAINILTDAFVIPLGKKNDWASGNKDEYV